MADKRLATENRNSIAIELLREAIHQDRFDLAIKLWKRFETVATAKVQVVISAICESLSRSVSNFEYKAFFFQKTVRFMSLKSLDRILGILESHIMQEGKINTLNS